METGIRLVAQHYNLKTNEIIDEKIIREDKLSKAEVLKELGYLHTDQIDFLQKIQDFKISHQIVLNCLPVCPKCKSKTKKAGTFKSNFHAALTDHKVVMQRTSCKCGWFSPSSIDRLFGSTMHPDLLEKQAIQGSKESYEKSSQSLNAESAGKRAINSHSQIYKSVKCVGEMLETIKSSSEYRNSDNIAETLIANIDGGHIKSRGHNRSFEAMVATVHRPTNIVSIDKNHNSIISKTSVASAKDDKQTTMKALFKRACKAQGMSNSTTVTCIADGADNCWDIAQSIKSECKEVVYILDWFHIAMRFQNIAIPEGHEFLFNKVKWHLWHGKPMTSLMRLEQLKSLIEDQSIKTKLNKLSTYISNNKEGIVNYRLRKKAGLSFTSNIAETTVNTLINDRQKGKRKMLWTREGAHNVLQIRTSSFSNCWREDWKKVESKLYLKAA